MNPTPAQKRADLYHNAFARYFDARRARDQQQQQPKPTQCPWDEWKSVRDLA